MRKYIILLIPVLFAVLGCNDSGGGGENRNFCYLPDSSDPCYDANEGGSTTAVADQTVDEVIAQEEGIPGFENELQIDDIRNGIKIPFPGDQICPCDQSELVIKTTEDWRRFRNSCVFGMENLPDVDFSENMVLVSTRDFAEFDTSIEAVLEFEGSLVTVIKDRVSDVPTPAPGCPFDIVSIQSRDLPVDFIRAEEHFSPFVQ